MEDRRDVLVCDAGSGFVKIGFAGDAFPEEFPCAVGRPESELQAPLGKKSDAASGNHVLVGRQLPQPKDLAGPRQALHISHPVTNGVVQNWEDMMRIWDHAFHEVLQTDTKGRTILLTEPPENQPVAREKTLEIMFETFGFSRAFIQLQAVLSLYSQGLMNGVVLDSGYGATWAVPVYDGCCPSHLTKRLNLAGKHISQYLLELLQRRGYPLSAGSDLAAAEDLKEKACYVTNNYEREVQLARETVSCVQTYTLPDGRVIRVGAERFAAPEALFSPELLGIEAPGVAELVHLCIAGCPIDTRLQLYQHVVLSGGSTTFPGFSSRMETELRSLYLDRVLKGDEIGLKKLKLKVDDPPRRRHQVFLGAAVLADIMKGQQDFWISKAEWEEDPSRAMKKCSGRSGG